MSTYLWITTLDAGFYELVSQPIEEAAVAQVLVGMGIPNPKTGLIHLGRNLLNLELIGRIHAQQPTLDLAHLTDEVELWDQYRQMVCDNEGGSAGPFVIAEAIKMARDALANPDGSFLVAYPSSRETDRLHSWGIIEHLDGRHYRFRHEKFQDYIYAWDATERLAPWKEVLNEIIVYRSRSIFGWMDRIYQKTKSPIRRQFLEDVLGVT